MAIHNKGDQQPLQGNTARGVIRLFRHISISASCKRRKPWVEDQNRLSSLDQAVPQKEPCHRQTYLVTYFLLDGGVPLPLETFEKPGPTMLELGQEPFPVDRSSYN